MNIIEKEPPTLDLREKWDPSFRDFVNSCLQKDPSKRPNIEDLFRNNKKFFAMAKNTAFLKQHFLRELGEVYLRKDKTLDGLAEQFFEKMGKGKYKQKKSSRIDIVWDFEEDGKL